MEVKEKEKKGIVEKVENDKKVMVKKDKVPALYVRVRIENKGWKEGSKELTENHSSVVENYSRTNGKLQQN